MMVGVMRRTISKDKQKAFPLLSSQKEDLRSFMGHAEQARPADDNKIVVLAARRAEPVAEPGKEVTITCSCVSNSLRLLLAGRKNKDVHLINFHSTRSFQVLGPSIG